MQKRTSMNGNYILHNRPGLLQRVDSVLTIGRYAAYLFFLSAAGITVVLALIRQYDGAVAMFVLSVGVSSYLYSSLVNQHIRVTEYAGRTLEALQARWDTLRSDDALLAVLATNKDSATLDPQTRLKLRLFLASFLDVQALIIHYIRRGYFRHTHEFAGVYEEMIRSLFQYKCFADIWDGKGDWGPGRIRNEFGGDLVFVVDGILDQIEKDRKKLDAGRAGLELPGSQTAVKE